MVLALQTRGAFVLDAAAAELVEGAFVDLIFKFDSNFESASFFNLSRLLEQILEIKIL